VIVITAIFYSGRVQPNMLEYIGGDTRTAACCTNCGSWSSIP